MRKLCRSGNEGRLSIGQLTLCPDYFNHHLRQVTYLFNKVILCIYEHAVKFVQVYAYLFVGKTDYEYLELGGPT